jgi:acyl-CoA thioester hydrolase
VITHHTHLRVRYADTDQMQIVYNGKYLEYFEVGRTELLRTCGLPYSEFERQGFRLPLSEAYCRYIAPARYDDMLIIESTVENYQAPRLRIDYRILLEATTSVLAIGHTVHAFMNIQTGRPVRPPQAFIAVLASYHSA